LPPPPNVHQFIFLHSDISPTQAVRVSNYHKQEILNLTFETSPTRSSSSIGAQSVEENRLQIHGNLRDQIRSK